MHPAIAELEEELSRPSAEDCALMRDLPGDVMVLGAGGKMGPSLARRVRRASDEAGKAHRVFAVSRTANSMEGFESGVESVACDLLDRRAVGRLPDCPNVLYLAGRKFGSSENMPLTWATNAVVPVLVGDRFRGSRIVVLSSGNVYPLSTEGATEETPVGPVGEYGQSVLGRERIFEYFANRDGTRVATIRLNYATDLRYGALLDIGQKVWEGKPVPLAMGRLNAIWQGDANSMVLRSLGLAESPARVLNVTGPQTMRVRTIAERFGELFEIAPLFEGCEGETALLNDASLACRLLGPPSVSVAELIERQAAWIRAGLPTLARPTHFEVRDGGF